MTPSGHKAEVKFLTVVFWDIRGFSKLCDTLRASSIPETLANGTLRASRIPDTLVKFLTEYYDDVKSTVTRNEGIVDKFMGDGVMARFGMKGQDNDDGTNDDAIYVVMAALQLRKSFGLIRSRWLDRWKRDIYEELDIGLVVEGNNKSKPLGIITPTDFIGYLRENLNIDDINAKILRSMQIGRQQLQGKDDKVVEDLKVRGELPINPQKGGEEFENEEPRQGT